MRELKDFETDVIGIIGSLTTRNFTNDLQKQLFKDKTKIRNSSNILISSDKTANLYWMEPEDYQKHLSNNITKTYKMFKPKEVDTFNRNLAKKIKLEEKMDSLSYSQAFVTIKDNKPRFTSRLDFRLINPAKPEKILDKINNAVKMRTNLAH